MGTFATRCTIENIIDRSKSAVMANRQQVTRSIGFAIIRLDKSFTVDEVVFAEKYDLYCL